MSNEIIEFISHFSNGKDLFLYGQCYWFAQILRERFLPFYSQVQIFYNPVANHFACAIDGILYDASGELAPDPVAWILWSDFMEDEPIETERIYRDCIWQLDPDTKIPSTAFAHNDRN